MRSFPEWNSKKSSSKIYVGQDINLRGSNIFLQAKKQEREKQHPSFFWKGKTDKGPWQLLPSLRTHCATDSPALQAMEQWPFIVSRELTAFPFIFSFWSYKNWLMEEASTSVCCILPTMTSQLKTSDKKQISDKFCLIGPSAPRPWILLWTVWVSYPGCPPSQLPVYC